MFKKILFLLDPMPNDDVMKRIQEEKVMSKYWLFLGGFFVCFVISIFFMGLSLVKFRHDIIPNVVIVPEDINEPEKLADTLMYPQQSYKTISLWLNEALQASYTLDFRHFDEQVRNASYYYSDSGFNSYKSELAASLEKRIKKDSLMMSVWANSLPIVVNSGGSKDSFWWRIRMDITLSFEGGGSKAIAEPARAEFFIIRVPPYKNPKSLNIVSILITPT